MENAEKVWEVSIWLSGAFQNMVQANKLQALRLHQRRAVDASVDASRGADQLTMWLLYSAVGAEDKKTSKQVKRFNEASYGGFIWQLQMDVVLTCADW